VAGFSLIQEASRLAAKHAMRAISSSLSKYVPQNPVVRYGIGIALVAVALQLSLVFESLFEKTFFGFFFPVAVIATTWFCGTRPGWLATALSMVVVQYYFIPPLRCFAIKLHDLPFSLTFFGCQVFAIWLVTKRKRTEDSLRQANAALVEEMAERERAEDSLRSARSELARVMRVTTVGELTASIAMRSINHWQQSQRIPTLALHGSNQRIQIWPRRAQLRSELPRAQREHRRSFAASAL
jgi:K+-sensing histidine kinase KdpD